MNLLVFTHYYDLDGVIGSVRWTNFISRLSKEHCIYVVTHSDSVGTEEVNVYKKSENITVLEVDNENRYIKYSKKRHADDSAHSSTASTQVSPRLSLKKQLKTRARNFVTMYFANARAKEIYRLVSRELKKENVKLDYVLSTSRPFINALSAAQFAKKFRLKWIMDQRDLPYSDGADKNTIQMYNREITRFDKYVTAYTIVSYGMADGLIEFCDFDDAQKKKVFVVHNGFSQKDKVVAPREEENTSGLTFAYAGDLYAGKRDATMLFDAISRLVAEGKAEKSDFVINYAGKASDSLQKVAEKFQLTQCIKDNGVVPRKKALQMQYNADMLLLLTWNTVMDRGILTGKIYEYMLMDKPIVCLTCGDVPDGEATETIEQLRLGIAVEQTSYEAGVLRLKDYLFEQLERKRKGEPLAHDPDREGVAEFDHDNLVMKLKNIMGI